MPANEIAPEDWLPFFNQFSRDHTGWLVTIQSRDDQDQPRSIVQSQPFQGISFDTKGSQPSSMAISTGDPSGLYTRHIVQLPLHIRLIHQGPDLDLQVEPAQGPQTLVHFQNPSH
jgi:hypothetical protein